MKTLVIHPTDSSTDFLSEIYSDKDYTIMRDDLSHKKVIEQIKLHDRIMMMGHGDMFGLYDIENDRFVIDNSLIYLLREKDCVCIWCNADVFVKRYNLKGFYTGMIISEYTEALYYSMYETTDQQIIESNILFSQSIKESVEKKGREILASMIELYKQQGNPIVEFNTDSLYYKD